MRGYFASQGMLILVAIVCILVGGSSRGGLLERTWHWTTTATGTPGSTSAVPDPARYSIEFFANRTFQATADCNVVTGMYRTTPPGRMNGMLHGMTITPGPVDLADCGAGSLSAVYVQRLGEAASYEIVGSRLTITLANEGTLTFR